MENTKKPLVVITGATGYIGSQIALKFLQTQNYEIWGTTRKITDEKIKVFEKYKNITFVKLDLQDENSIFKAIEGATYVIHVASPITGNFENTDKKKSLIEPAVEGTQTIMKACVKYGVRRIVITSSYVACSYGHPSDKLSFSVDDWSQTDEGLEGVTDYARSKTFAEKSAWNFMENLDKNASNLECVTILPGLVCGPYFIKQPFASGNIFKMFFDG